MSYLCVVMILDIVFLLLGLVLILWGADRFTDGATGLARRWNVSELVIGLTIVALGTSLPEFMVSFMGAIRGSGDMSVSNVMGSNIFNTLIILGVSCLLVDVRVSKGALLRDMPYTFLVSVVLSAVGILYGGFSRWSALLLLCLFGVFLAYSLYLGKTQNCDLDEKGSDANPKQLPSLGKLFLLLVLGLLCLVGGGKLIVDSAAELARLFGITERVIGLTILAGGTSLPELVTSVFAAKKGYNGLAVGNVLGSNIFNICFVLGACNMIAPMQISGIGLVDWAMLTGSCLLLWFFSFTGRRLVRWEGLLLMGCYLAYLASLLA